MVGGGGGEEREKSGLGRVNGREGEGKVVEGKIGQGGWIEREMGKKVKESKIWI